MKKILDDLFSFQDKEYRDFNSKLIPNVDKDNIIGVRSPVLRKYEKKIRNTSISQEFLSTLPHKYIEEYTNEILDYPNNEDYYQQIKGIIVSEEKKLIENITFKYDYIEIIKILKGE